MTVKIGEEVALTVREAAEMVGVSRDAVWSWITRGVDGIRLRAGRIGRQWATSREALQEFQERLTERRLGRDGESQSNPSAPRRRGRPTIASARIAAMRSRLERRGRKRER
jgi:excisionase family DNA binding protein